MSAGSGYVYIGCDGDDTSRYKVGFTAGQTPQQLVRRYLTALPRFRVLHWRSHDNARELERRTLEHFGPYRQVNTQGRRSEWVELPFHLILCTVNHFDSALSLNLGTTSTTTAGQRPKTTNRRVPDWTSFWRAYETSTDSTWLTTKKQLAYDKAHHHAAGLGSLSLQRFYHILQHEHGVRPARRGAGGVYVMLGIRRRNPLVVYQLS